MKNKNPKISANEINRYCYCPYQWYYKRYYGTKELNERYKALGIKAGEYESRLEEGRKFHKKYYRIYRLQRVIRRIVIVVIALFILWMVMTWNLSYKS